MRDQGGITVDDSFCPSPKPSLSQTCSAPACGAQACNLPWGGTIPDGQSVLAYQASSVTSPATCQSQTRVCSNGTLSGTYQFQSCSVQGGTFSWVKGFSTLPEPNMSVPPYNAPYTDANYHTTVTRITDVSSIPSHPSWIRHEYSRRPAFNKDSSKILMLSSGGQYHIYNVNAATNTVTYIKQLGFGNDTSEPTWSADEPNIIYHLQGLKIFRYDITNDNDTVYRDLTNLVHSNFPLTSNATGVQAWTKGEGRPSNDGKTWCFMISRYDSSAQQTTYYGIMSYKIDTQTVPGKIVSTDGDMPDHISTSPLGNYCVPGWGVGKGTRAYDLTFTNYTQLFEGVEHTDLALTKTGREVYVYFDYEHNGFPHPENDGYIMMTDMQTGVRTRLLNTYGPNHSTSGGHISGLAMNKPGYVVVSFEGCGENYGSAPCNPLTQYFYHKILIVALNPDTAHYPCDYDHDTEPNNCDPNIVYNAANDHYSDAGYWSETQATVNPDLTKILFVSAWGGTTESSIQDFMIDVPAGSLP